MVSQPSVIHRVFQNVNPHSLLLVSLCRMWLHLRAFTWIKANKLNYLFMQSLPSYIAYIAVQPYFDLGPRLLVLCGGFWGGIKYVQGLQSDLQSIHVECNNQPRAFCMNWIPKNTLRPYLPAVPPCSRRVSVISTFWCWRANSLVEIAPATTSQASSPMLTTSAEIMVKTLPATPCHQQQKRREEERPSAVLENDLTNLLYAKHNRRSWIFNSWWCFKYYLGCKQWSSVLNTI